MESLHLTCPSNTEKKDTLKCCPRLLVFKRGYCERLTLVMSLRGVAELGGDVFVVIEVK